MPIGITGIRLNRACLAQTQRPAGASNSKPRLRRSASHSERLGKAGFMLRYPKGFTLIEILVVITIILLLLSLAIALSGGPGPFLGITTEIWLLYSLAGNGILALALTLSMRIKKKK